ncbi:MAG: hypothetical protein ACO4AJ_13840 [Prochlorothrix sp.]|jgi:hypothetical protein
MEINTASMPSASTAQVKYTSQPWFVNLSTDTQLEVGDMIDLDGYPAYDIEDFISEFGEKAFTDGYYKTWEKLTNSEGHSENAVRAFIDEFGIREIGSFADSYVGQYPSEAAFAEEYFTENYHLDVLSQAGICVDWDTTWTNCLEPSYTWVGGYVFNNDF